MRYITFWDQSDILIPCVEANRPSGPRSSCAVVGIGPDTHSGRPTSQYQWDSCGKWLIVNGLAQGTRPCTFVGFEKISILRASPAPDSAGPGGYWPRYPLRPSDVSIPVGFVWEVANSERISPGYTTVYFCWV